MNEFLNLPPLRSPRKPKIKQMPIVYRHDIKGLYKQAHEDNIKRSAPKGYEGGYYKDFKFTFPDIKTTNGHNKYIENVINFLGHHAEQIKTMGTPVKQKDGSIKWRYSNSTNGSPDIHTIVNGKDWKIETKNKDSMRKAQIKYQDKMQRIGILHSVIRVGELDLFWDEYYKIMAL